MRKFYFAVIACVLSCFTANAQNKNIDTPYGFVNVRGGGQTILLKQNAGDMKISPAAGASLGYMFNPYIGSRLDFEGVWNKVDLNGVDFDYNNLTTDLDLLLNLTNCFRKEKAAPFNLFLVGGAGFIANLYDGKYDVDNFVNDWYNFRAGAIADYRLSRNTSINLEVDGNYMGGSKSEIYGNGKWKVAAFLGLTYKFPMSAKKPAEPVEVPVVRETYTESKPVETAPVVKEEVKKDEPLKETFFYSIRESDPEPESLINKIVEWCKKYPNKNITIDGYADKGTGNPTINKSYSQSRANKIAQKLEDRGVSKSQMIVNSYGDTVQPYAENDKNRCVIIMGK